MLLPSIVLALFAAIVGLYLLLRARAETGSLWRSTLAIASAIGVARAALAGLGWYGVEHTGGPFQVPAFALAMLAWPEAVLFGRQPGPRSASFYLILGFVLIVSSFLLVGAVALLVRANRARRA
jgi:hypothetical protein